MDLVRSRGALVALLVLGAASLLPAAIGGSVAQAAGPGTPTQLPAPNACFANLAIGGCSDDPFNSFLRPLGVDVSPDGTDVYVANQSSDLGHFRRNPATNALTPAGEANFGGSDELHDVIVAAGSTLAFAAGGSTSGDGRIEAFTRNPSTGALTPLGCADEGVVSGCLNADGLGGADEVAVPPSGPGVYVASEYGGPDGGDGGSTPDGSIAALSLNTSSGAFTQLRCVAATDAASGPCGSQSGDEPVVDGAAAVVVSPDGRNVYFGGFGGVVGYNRDPATGNLVSEAECIRRTGGGEPLCPLESRLPVVSQLALSADGEFLFVGGGTALTVLDRNTVSGTLSFVECIKAAGTASSCPVEPDFDGATGLATTPDGATLYTAGGGFGEGFLRAFRVDRGTGKLTDLACITYTASPACVPGAGLLRPFALDASSDGAGLYMSSYEGTGTGDPGALAAFQIEQAPASPPAAPAAADKKVRIEVLGKKLKLNGKGVGRLKLKCPADEQSPPCAGNLVLKTRKAVDQGGARSSKRKKVKLATAKFKIGAGKTAKVKLKLTSKRLLLVEENANARKAIAITTVKDGAGNSATVKKSLKVVPKP